MSESIARMMQARPGGGTSVLAPEYELRAYNDNGYYIASRTVVCANLREAFSAAYDWGRGWARTTRVFVNGEEQARPS